MTNNNEQGLPQTAAKPAPGAVSRIRNYFLTGLIVAGPVAVTLWLIWWFVTWVDNLVRPFIPVTYRPETYLPVHIPGLGLIIAFVALTLLGFLTANLVGRKLVDIGEGFLSRMPIVRPIYRTAKQIFQTLFSSSGSSFRRVGLVEFPSPGMWSLVFLTQSPSAEISARLPATEHVSAFMPCTPNPTTGFFFYVPRRDVIDLDITVEAAMQLLMSAGIIQPGGDDAQKRLATLAETARAAQAVRAAGAHGGEIAEPARFAARPAKVRGQNNARGAIMGFVEAIKSGFSHYVTFFGPRLPVGILVLGPVRANRWNGHSGARCRHLRLPRRCVAAQRHLLSGHLFAGPRGGRAAPSRYGSDRMVAPAPAHRHWRHTADHLVLSQRNIRPEPVRSRPAGFASSLAGAQ